MLSARVAVASIALGVLSVGALSEAAVAAPASLARPAVSSHLTLAKTHHKTRHHARSHRRHYYLGQVTARRALAERARPTSRSAHRGALRHGARVALVCKVHGQSVHGNSLWYRLPNGSYVSARYVSNIGRAPRFC
jgi:hypothetical protein